MPKFIQFRDEEAAKQEEEGRKGAIPSVRKGNNVQKNKYTL